MLCLAPGGSNLLLTRVTWTFQITATSNCVQLLTMRLARSGNFTECSWLHRLATFYHTTICHVLHFVDELLQTIHLQRKSAA